MVRHFPVLHFQVVRIQSPRDDHCRPYGGALDHAGRPGCAARTRCTAVPASITGVQARSGVAGNFFSGEAKLRGLEDGGFRSRRLHDNSV